MKFIITYRLVMHHAFHTDIPSIVFKMYIEILKMHYLLQNASMCHDTVYHKYQR